MTSILSRGALAICLCAAAGGPLPATDVSGTVKDVCGPVLPGTSVSAVDGSGVTARGVTDGQGRYSLRHLAPGQWTLTFALTGFETLQQHLRITRDGEPVPLNVRLLPDLLMKQELHVSGEQPPVRYRRYSVRGAVRDRSGEPIPAATVQLQDVGSQKNPWTGSCTTDELGRYSVTGWAPIDTTWKLSVQAVGRADVHQVLTLVADEPQTIDLSLDKLKQ